MRSPCVIVPKAVHFITSHILLTITILLFSGGSVHAQATAFLNADEQAWVEEHPEIEIGVDGNWAPVDFFDDQGIHQGITAEYLKIIGNKLGIRFVPRQSATFKGMLNKHLNKKVSNLIWDEIDKDYTRLPLEKLGAALEQHLHS